MPTAILKVLLFYFEPGSGMYMWLLLRRTLVLWSHRQQILSLKTISARSTKALMNSLAANS